MIYVGYGLQFVLVAVTIWLLLATAADVINGEWRDDE